jgi:hypothetical protein
MSKNKSISSSMGICDFINLLDAKLPDNEDGEDIMFELDLYPNTSSISLTTDSRRRMHKTIICNDDEKYKYINDIFIEIFSENDITDLDLILD